MYDKDFTYRHHQGPVAQMQHGPQHLGRNHVWAFTNGQVGLADVGVAGHIPHGQGIH